MKVAIVSSSLNPGSRSRLMALAVREALEGEAEVEVDWIDLQELALPLCDGGAAYGNPAAVELNERMEWADCYVIASPIYNFDFNAALKNVVELSGRKMENKLAGFLCAAGGALSYMSAMSLANSLMLDFRVLILPRFVFANGEDWEGDVLKPQIQSRLTQFASDFLALGRKLAC